FDAFGVDPSLEADSVTRTMQQAMFMMNNRQLDAQIKADPDSGTFLSRLLQSEPDDAQLIDRLFVATLARRPTEQVKTILLEHTTGMEDRGAAFEDVLWSLLNTAEFTLRR